MGDGMTMQENVGPGSVEAEIEALASGPEIKERSAFQRVMTVFPQI